MAQQQVVHKFVLGNKELEGKVAEFQYDKGWYSITDIVGEEHNVIYKSRNAQEAYMKWNVYIGRKKERVIPDDRRKANQEKNEQGNRPQRENHETSEIVEVHGGTIRCQSTASRNSLISASFSMSL